jgi:hypothetical protein
MLEGPEPKPLGPRTASGEAVNDILGQLDKLAPDESAGDVDKPKDE